LSTRFGVNKLTAESAALLQPSEILLISCFLCS
jgi:hypothetical protein